MFKRRRLVEEEEEQPVAAPEEQKSAFDVAALQNKVHKLLKFSTFEPEQRYWLDTGFPELNNTFGARDKGIPYGKMIELAGEEHAGKTLISLLLAGMAQKHGAAVGRIDLEDSRDDQWDRKLGLDPTQIYNIYPRLVVGKADDDAPKKKGKKKRVGSGMRLQSAEEIFHEAEIAMEQLSGAGFKKQFWIIDSVANIQTEMGGSGERNMRVSNDRALFLSQTFPKWAALAANYNATVFLVNQLRDKPGVMFGDPTYSPGGRALRHGCQVRCRIRRGAKGGTIKRNEEIVGLRSIIKNTKNKSGGGCVQGGTCGFKIKWAKAVAVYDFMPVEDLEG